MNRSHRILCAIAVASLTACSVQPVTSVIDASNLEARAEAEASGGDLGAAAAIYRELADNTNGATRSGYLIAGARLQIERGELEMAALWLMEADATAGAEQRMVKRTLDARIAVRRNQPELALQTLNTLQPPLPIDVMVEASAVRGQALFALGRHAEAVATLVEREVWLDEAESVLANQRMIWDGFRGAATLQAPAPSGDPIVDGWLALAPLAQGTRDDLELRRALLEWRNIYVDHPAVGGLLAELLNQRRPAGAYPMRVALLLPMSSAQREAAIAVRDGFFAAHLEFGARREGSIQIYDTAALGSQEAYLRAQLDGADFIVGPLLRPNVEQVVTISGFVPTLTLNFSQQDAPFLAGLNQFALAPEDEARAVAQRAIADGARTAIAIIASNDWGYRVLNAFRTEFESLGGRVLDFAGYDLALLDFTPQITTLLNISRSTQRYQRLAANLGTPIEFEARRRQDVDVILLGADTPRAARQLAPQLRFYEAGNIPTYATSAIYEPGNPGSDADLNGVMFPDAPLLVAPDVRSSAFSRELGAHWPRRAVQLIRFYGMGYDAYRLMDQLYSSSEPFWPLSGLSGNLNPDAQGRIHRVLPFAQFQNGRPVRVADIPLPINLDAPIIGAR